MFIDDRSYFLYDGGWRKDDRNELIFCYGFTDEEADQVCKELAEIEERNNVEE